MTRIVRGCAVLLLAAVLAGCSVAPKRPDPRARGDYARIGEFISALARAEMHRNNVTGLSIALVDGQQVVWAEGIGYRDKANRLPATPDTVYRVGSISKLLTATAVMQLVEQGKLDIDRPLTSCIPDFSIRRRFPDMPPVTPRTLMTHHGGLPSDLLKGMWTKAPEPIGAIVAQLRDEYALRPPGTVFSYSNLGVTLLGVAVEKITGERFPSRLESSVLRPLGMEQSSFAPFPDRSPLASKAYRNGREVEEPGLRDVPAGGLNSSVLDLSRFVRMVFAGGRAGERRILSPESLSEMLRRQNAGIPLDLDFRVGLGWLLGGPGDIDIPGAGPVAHHSGATLFHRGKLIILPEHELGVVVLSNSSSAGKTVSNVATEALKAALEARTGIRQPERTAPATADGALSPEALRSYEGRYDTAAGVLTLSGTSRRLKAEITSRTIPLVPRADGLLAPRYRLFGLFPISLGELDRLGIGTATVNGHELLKARMDGSEILVGSRIRPVAIPAKWLERVGEYEVADPGGDVVLFEKLRLRHDRGLLLADYRVPLFFPGVVTVALAPLSDDEAVVAGLGRGRGETVRAVLVDGTECLRFSGYLLRKKAD